MMLLNVTDQLWHQANFAKGNWLGLIFTLGSLGFCSNVARALLACTFRLSLGFFLFYLEPCPRQEIQKLL